MSKEMPRKSCIAFTLAELLIALSILGMIATFTIPKVLQSQQDGRYNSLAKEAMGTISDAYTRLKQEKGLTASTTTGDLLPYLNYVKQVTDATLIDRSPYNGAGTSYTCSAVPICLLLHNGALITIYSQTWNGVDAIDFTLDPSGKYEGKNDSLYIELYYKTGRITSFGNVLPNTVMGSGTYNPNPNNDPSWFSWN